MAHFERSFFSDEDGAVTLDWVILCAAIVVIAGVWLSAIADVTMQLDQGTADQIATFTPD